MQPQHIGVYFLKGGQSVSSKIFMSQSVGNLLSQEQFQVEERPMDPWLVSVLAVQMMQLSLGITRLSVEENERGNI